MSPLTRKDITLKILFDKRRNFLKLGAASVVASSTVVKFMVKETLPLQNLKFKKDTNKYQLERNSFKKSPLIIIL